MTEDAWREENDAEVRAILAGTLDDIRARVRDYRADMRALARVNPELTEEVQKSVEAVDAALDAFQRD